MQKQPSILGSKAFITVFIISVIVTILRRPDILLNAQFWAEDGHVWFTHMHHDGWASLFRSRDGYFQTVSRLAAGVAMLAPLEHAPLVMNSVFITVKALLVSLLFTRRLTHLSNSIVLRVMAALFILLVPDSQEVHGNVTNAHWFLSLLALLLILSEASSNIAVRFFDIVVVIIAGLSGPFSIILAPLALFWSYASRHSQVFFNRALTFLLCAAAGVQFLAVLLTGGGRSSVELGASFTVFVKVIASRTIAPVFLGTKSSDNIWHNELMAFFVFILGAMMILYALWKASTAVKIIIVYGMLVLGAAMLSPMLTLDPNEKQWLGLEIGGGRYFVIPLICVFVAFLVFVAEFWGRNKIINSIIAVLLLCTVISLRNDFSIKPLKNCGWKEQVAAFRAGKLPENKIAINPSCSLNHWHVDLQ